MIERVEVFRALVGSHNYNLSTPESDKDFKVFVLPTFDDLYDRKEYAKSVIGETEDFDIHDVRKLVNLFWKANINFIETLFSNQFVMGMGHINFCLELYRMKNEIASMNLPYLYNACWGMHYTKMSALEKGTSGTQHLMDKYGYCTKNALHAFRVLDFLQRFMDTDFKDFKNAMTYNEQEAKQVLLIKDGVFSLEEFRTFMSNKRHSINELCDGAYKNNKPNEELKNKLEQMIRDLVRKHVTQA